MTNFVLYLYIEFTIIKLNCVEQKIALIRRYFSLPSGMSAFELMFANLFNNPGEKPGKTQVGFSNPVSIIRQQLMNYINLYGFLEDPEDSWRKIIKENKLKYQNPLIPEIEGAYFSIYDCIQNLIKSIPGKIGLP